MALDASGNWLPVLPDSPAGDGTGNGGGSGGGGAQQVLEYTTTDPTTDGLIPADPTKPAVAYKRDGSGATYYWNTDLQIWN